MGWARTLLLGDIGNRLDIADTEQDISTIRQALAAKHSVDDSQDVAIQHLLEENAQLKLCVVAIVKALETKGVFAPNEVSNLANMIDDPM